MVAETKDPDKYISFFFKLFFKLINFWLCWVCVAASRLSLFAVHGLLIMVASLVAKHGL